MGAEQSSGKQSGVRGVSQRMVTEKLLKESHFTHSEMEHLVTAFKKASGNSGRLHRDQLAGVLKDTGVDIDNSLMLDRIFGAFDKDDSGYVDLKEFIQGVSVLHKGTLFERIHFSFDVYDADKSGVLDHANMYPVLISRAKAFCGVAGKNDNADELKVEADEIEAFLQEVFGDNKTLTMKQYTEAVKKHPELLGFRHPTASP